MSSTAAEGSEQKTTVPTPQLATASIDAKLENAQQGEMQGPASETSGASAQKGSGKCVKVSGANVDERHKTETQADLEITELLGSVTTHNCPGTRTSARVIQKMKQDLTRPTTPPHAERDGKKDDKTTQKTPSQMRANKPTWTNTERNHFFDALNEYGKDFDALGSYINTKLKRKCTTDAAFKTKDQVRQHYYQTYHKICKYIKFSDEVKKPVQELYALINYGEMRRKLQFVTDKHFMKLKNLVYQGHITVRCKGKNIRIKTPSCKALRRLNQLDDTLEDIRLPSKIEVIVTPANMEAFGRVQTIAQNPRARTTVPLHKKLVNFIKAFQYKWRSAEMKLAEEETKLFPNATAHTSNEHNGQQPTGDTIQAQFHTNVNEKPICLPSYQDPEMCFLPKPGVAIHRPLLSITEYLSSMNICLTAFEERMGVKVRGESLCQERPNSKRQRTDSGSEKRSPDTKKQKQQSSPLHEKSELEGVNDSAITIKEETLSVQEGEVGLLKCESSSDELSDELQELLADTDNAVLTFKETDCVKAENAKEEVLSNNCSAAAMTSCSSIASNAPSAQQARTRRNTNTKNARNALTFKPLISEDVIRRIRKGWTASTAGDITIGDLYVVFGQDSRLELDYYWNDSRTANVGTVHNGCISQESTAAVPLTNPAALFLQKQNGMPYNPTDCDDPHLLKTLSSASVGNKLKHLLLIANLSERMRKRQCSCGHTCERNTVRTRIERELASKTFVSTKTFASSNSGDGGNLFRQPVVPIRRPIFSMDPVKQLSALTRQKLPRQVLVQRLLLPVGENHSYDMLDVKSFQTNGTNGQRSAAEIQEPPSKSAVTFRQAANSHNATNTDHIEPSTSTAAALNNECEANNQDIATVLSYVSAAAIPPDIPKSVDTDEISTKQDVTDCGTSTRAYHSIAGHKADGIETIADFSLSSSFAGSTFDECSNISGFNGTTPAHLLRESSSNSRWLEENLNDFSLTSLLGHLDEINASGDILDPSSNLSVISESSVDYMHKFQEITALMQSQEKE